MLTQLHKLCRLTSYVASSFEVAWTRFFYIISSVASSIGLDSEVVIANGHLHVNPIKPEFTIDISIHYKPRTAVAILDL